MRAGRATLAAMVAAGLLVGLHGPSPAQSPAPEGGGPKPADAGVQAPPAAETKPPEGGAPKPAEGGAQKPADDSSMKPRLLSILGRELTNRDGDGGRVIDVLVDLDGRLGAVVVEFGGFMGIGSRKVAVEWNALRFVRDGNRSSLVVDISREQIRDAPEYKPNEPSSVLTTK